MEYSDLLFSNLIVFFPFFSDTIAVILNAGVKMAIIALLALSGLVFYQLRKRMITEFKVRNAEEAAPENEGSAERMQKCKEQLIDSLRQTNTIYSLGITGFLNEDLVSIKNARSLKKDLNRILDKRKDKIFAIAPVFEKKSQSGHFFIQLNDYQNRMNDSLSLLLDPLYEHLNNSHKPFIQSQAEELTYLMNQVSLLLSRTIDLLKTDQFVFSESPVRFHDNLDKTIEKMGVAQIKRIKTNQVNTRNSILFLNVLSETKNMVNHISGMLHSYSNLANVLKN